MSDIVLDILAGLSDVDRQEISELTQPMVGDAVWSQARELDGKYGGGEITHVDKTEDEPLYTVCWWDGDEGGYMKDNTVFEKMDFVFFKDGKSGRTWFTI